MWGRKELRKIYVVEKKKKVDRPGCISRYQLIEVLVGEEAPKLGKVERQT